MEVSTRTFLEDSEWLHSWLICREERASSKIELTWLSNEDIPKALLWMFLGNLLLSLSKLIKMSETDYSGKGTSSLGLLLLMLHPMSSHHTCLWQSGFSRPHSGLASWCGIVRRDLDTRHSHNTSVGNQE